jgi:predicted short-subunit dehydrogenase-like oxidoreductase (DUF2520 family)
MGPAPRTALIVEGAVSDSWLLQLHTLRDCLGPVMGVSLRNASRAVNQLRAGSPSNDLAALTRADLLLISVPADSLPQWLTRLAPVAEDWRNTAVVLCSDDLGSEALASLHAAGSLAAMDGLDRRFLFEGHKLAGHRVRRLIEAGQHARLFEIKAGHKSVYQAGLSFAAGMTFPLIAAAVDSFRAAGLHPKFAESTVETAVLSALRGYLRAGRRGWTGPIARADRDVLARQYQALFTVDEELAEMFLKIALDYLAAKRDRSHPESQS